MSQQNTALERAPPTSRSKPAGRGKSEKQTPPSRPGGDWAPDPCTEGAAGETAPPALPQDGAARGRPRPPPFHGQSGQALPLASAASCLLQPPRPGHRSGCQACLNSTSPPHGMLSHQVPAHEKPVKSSAKMGLSMERRIGRPRKLQGDRTPTLPAPVPSRDVIPSYRRLTSRSDQVAELQNPCC